MFFPQSKCKMLYNEHLQCLQKKYSKVFNRIILTERDESIFFIKHNVWFLCISLEIDFPRFLSSLLDTCYFTYKIEYKYWIVPMKKVANSRSFSNLHKIFRKKQRFASWISFNNKSNKESSTLLFRICQALKANVRIDKEKK